MKSLFILITLFAGLFAGDLVKFAGAQSKSATVSSGTIAFASVDPVTSQVGAQVGVVSGKVEVLAVYSPYVKTSKGWSWIELLKINSDLSVSCDENTEGRLGVACLGKQNDLSTVNTTPILPGEKLSVTDTWPQWVKVKAGTVTGWVYIASLKLE